MNTKQESRSVRGIHHVTAIAGDAQRNVDFYVGVLGMRLVKRTVNQDAPETYHLFYADAVGNPGTDLTFFIWPDLAKGRPGTGQTVEVALAVPAGSLERWRERLLAHGTPVGEIGERFGERALPISDPDGMAVTLVESKSPAAVELWKGSPVPEEDQIRGFHGVRLLEADASRTISLLRELFGFVELGCDGGFRRYGLPGGGASRILDIREDFAARGGALGKGSVHHVAWNIGEPGEQEEFRDRVAAFGLSPTQVIDRFWFKSVYFREPGGALFEAATAGPGFLVDESNEDLGNRLILPPRFEPYRSEIEAILPPFELPQAAAKA